MTSQTKPQLAKGTRHGYTAVPNWLIDDSLREANSAATLGAALYLLRHVPGQGGVLSLNGEFAEQEVSADLGLSPDQVAACLDELAGIGVVSLPTADMLEISAPLKAPALRQQLARLASGQEKKEKEELKNNNRAGARVRVDPFDRGPAKAADDNESVKLIFARYAQLYGNPVHPRHAESFTHRLVEVGIEVKEVLARLAELAAHPLLKTQVKSINAVWEMPVMHERAGEYDRNVRAVLAELGRTCLTLAEIENEISAMAQRGAKCKVDRDQFVAYFQAEIEALRAKANEPQASVRAGEVEADTLPVFATEQSNHVLPSWALTLDEVEDALKSGQQAAASAEAEPVANVQLYATISDEQSSQDPNAALLADLAKASATCAQLIACVTQAVSANATHPEASRLLALRDWVERGIMSYALAERELTKIKRRLEPSQMILNVA